MLGYPGAIAQAPGGLPNGITIDYPENGSIFPPDLAAPAVLWRDSAGGAGAWRIDVEFGDGSPSIRVSVPGQRVTLGEIDPRALADTNRLPGLTPEQAEQWTWTPDAATWDAMKRRSVEHPARITITSRSLSAGSVTIRTWFPTRLSVTC